MILLEGVLRGLGIMDDGMAMGHHMVYQSVIATYVGRENLTYLTYLHK